MYGCGLAVSTLMSGRILCGYERFGRAGRGRSGPLWKASYRPSADPAPTAPFARSFAAMTGAMATWDRNHMETLRGYRAPEVSVQRYQELALSLELACPQHAAQVEGGV